jgi:hypothetical protein
MPGSIRVDMSEWLQRLGKAKNYYQAYLALFVAHNVLFEDYHGGESTGNGQLGGFTADVFEPAWHAVRDRFGVAPMITPLPWFPELAYYPANGEWMNHGIIPDELLSDVA